MPDDVLMDGQTVADSPTTTTVEDLVASVSDSVVASLSPRLEALEAGLASVSAGSAGRLQVDGLSERLDVLSVDLQSVSASLSAKVDEATLLTGEELGPVLGDEFGAVLIQLLSLLDNDGDGSSDVLSAVRDVGSVVQDVSDVLVHPALTTNFADYSVLEALLLLLVLWKFWLFLCDIVRGGFSWLR